MTRMLPGPGDFDEPEPWDTCPECGKAASQIRGGQCRDCYLTDKYEDDNHA